MVTPVQPRPVEAGIPRSQAKSPVAPASSDNSETELIPDETVHLSKVSVSSAVVNQEIPIEISVGREGQDIKLNIAIHLRIRVTND